MNAHTPPTPMAALPQAVVSWLLLGLLPKDVAAQQAIQNPAAVGAVAVVETFPAPSQRAWAAGAEDLFSGGMFIHGGYDPAIANSLGDLWRYQAGTWSQYPFPGPGPSARSGHAMILDPVRGELVLFGGFASGLPASRDTWVFRLNNNSWGLAATNGPSPRVDHEMVFDLNRGTGYLFGGFDLWLFSPTAELWAWQGGSWTLTQTINPPPARSAHRMVMDVPRDRVWLFGGYDAIGNPLGDTWFLDLNTMTWTPLATASGPAPRAWPNLSYDTAQQTVVLHGGLLAGGVDAADVWTLDPSGWRQVKLQGQAPALDGSVFAYDSVSGNHILFGGFDGMAGGNSVTGKSWRLGVASEPGFAIEIGSGCPGAFPDTRLTMQGSLSVGAPILLQLDSLPGTGGVAFLAFGADIQGAMGTALPVPLNSIGLPTCRLRTDLLQVTPLGYSSPTANHVGVMPNNPALLGKEVTAQFLAVSTLNERAVSNGLFGVIGN